MYHSLMKEEKLPNYLNHNSKMRRMVKTINQRRKRRKAMRK
jgi:hypothetical protein